MSNTLSFSVYDDHGVLQAKVVDFYVAAAIVGNVMQDGATVRYGRTVLWTEGDEFDGLAGESYDNAADVMDERLRAFFQRKVARRNATV